jgi:hypothetical protein
VIEAILIAAVIGSGVTSAAATKRAGYEQEEQLRQQAEQERIAAEARELQRREELNRVLAARQMALASSGIAGEGTPQSIALSAAKKIGMGEGLESLTSELKQAQLKRAGRNARVSGNIQAGSTLLNTAMSAAALGSAGGGNPPSGGGGGGALPA